MYNKNFTYKKESDFMWYFESFFCSSHGINTDLQTHRIFTQDWLNFMNSNPPALACFLYGRVNGSMYVLEGECLWFWLFEISINVKTSYNESIRLGSIRYCTCLSRQVLLLYCLCILFTYTFVVLFVDFCLLAYHFLCWCLLL